LTRTVDAPCARIAVEHREVGLGREHVADVEAVERRLALVPGAQPGPQHAQIRLLGRVRDLHRPVRLVIGVRDERRDLVAADLRVRPGRCPRLGRTAALDGVGPLAGGPGALALNSGPSRAAAGHLVEHPLGGLAGDHGIGHRIGVLLVRIAGLAHAAAQLDPGALLHHVRGLVRRRVQIRRFAERHRRAGRIRGRSDLLARLGRRAADVRLDARHVVAPEQRLDLRAVGQRLAGARDALLGDRGDVPAAAAVRLALHRRQCRGQRALAGGRLRVVPSGRGACGRATFAFRPHSSPRPRQDRRSSKLGDRPRPCNRECVLAGALAHVTCRRAAM
jgi:hypothetical protein